VVIDIFLGGRSPGEQCDDQSHAACGSVAHGFKIQAAKIPGKGSGIGLISDRQKLVCTGLL
jgi:hypothetical protein